jgi:hypothetical protein
MFDCKQSKEEADALSLRGLTEVAKAWQRGDLYAQLWMMLYHNGRIAPSPIEARSRMRDALEAEEYGWGNIPRASVSEEKTTGPETGLIILRLLLSSSFLTQ